MLPVPSDSEDLKTILFVRKQEKRPVITAEDGLRYFRGSCLLLIAKAAQL